MLATSPVPFSETKLLLTRRAWSHQSTREAKDKGPSAWLRV